MYKTRTPTPPAPPALRFPRLADDTEDAPWMVMGDAQFWATLALANSVEHYALTHGHPWYVAGLLPILYRRPGEARKRQVAPDLMVAFAPRHRRDSYDLDDEGVFPTFVLEVLSPSSASRDVQRKRLLYEALGANEYALFAPQSDVLSPPLQGFRRGIFNRFEPWQPDADGRLWSEVLGLAFVAEGGILRVLDPSGAPIRTYEESQLALEESQLALEESQLALEESQLVLEERQLALEESEARLANEVAARRAMEQELARLRALLERTDSAEPGA